MLDPKEVMAHSERYEEEGFIIDAVSYCMVYENLKPKAEYTAMSPEEQFAYNREQRLHLVKRLFHSAYGEIAVELKTLQNNLPKNTSPEVVESLDHLLSRLTLADL